MRKFIVSDLHGDGVMYNIIMRYLDFIGTKDEVTLYINGDLVDRGKGSYRILIDVMERMTGKGNVNIEYLAGNHELMMYEAYLDRKNGKFKRLSDWYLNGGKTLGTVIENSTPNIQNDIFNLIKNLKIYHKFSETIQDKNILLVHAAAPKEIKDECDMTISDNDKKVFKALWTREDDGVIFTPKIGHKDYFTIIGHTPIRNEFGFEYNDIQNYLNIDGGCSGHVLKKSGYDHVPLVEVLDNSLEIQVFKHNGGVDNIYTFDGKVKVKSMFK